MSLEFITEKLVGWLERVQTQLPSNAMAQFKLLATDEDRFLYVWRLQCVQDAIQLEPAYTAKSTTEAARHRNLGNAYFQRKSYMPALDEYNRSVRFAPTKLSKKAKGKKELALAYGNRSAALMHMKYYELSVRDTELALDHGYPEELKYKLYDRRGKCFVQLKRTEEAEDSFLRASECLASAKLDEDVREKWTQAINKQMLSLAQVKPGSSPARNEEKESPRMRGEPNSTRPSASDAVDIAWNSSKGRHGVASTDVSVGDVLVREKPYASVLYPEFFEGHCYNCFRRLLAPVPCIECSTVVYCSKVCQTASWESVHHYECHCMSLFHKDTCGIIGHLAARVAMVKGWKELLRYKREARKGDIPSGEKEAQGISPVTGVYVFDDYHTVYNLVTNVTQRTADGLFDFTVFAAYLLRVLLHSKFLPEPDTDSELTEKRMCLIGGVLLRHLQIIQCNAVGIKEIQHPTDFESLEPTDIGTGLYTTGALLNHSCDANSDFVFYNNTLVLRAMRQIRTGEEVTCCYGPAFSDCGLRERYVLLKCRYSFECSCPACEKNWPIWKDMEHSGKSTPQFHCQECRAWLPGVDMGRKSVVKCKRCNTSQDLAEAVNKLQASHEEFRLGMETAVGLDPINALPHLTQHLVLLQRHTKMPWRDTVACQQAVRNCYRLMGNTRI